MEQLKRAGLSRETPILAHSVERTSRHDTHGRPDETANQFRRDLDYSGKAEAVPLVSARRL